MSVNYGYAGTVPEDYLIRLASPENWPDLLMRITLAFGPLWVGVWGLRRMPRRMQITAGLFIVLVIVATLLLSSRITRVLGVLYVVVIPGVLILLPSEPHRQRAPDT